MHTFDIRRSESVVELWKRYKDEDHAGDCKCDTPDIPGSVVHEGQHEPPSVSDEPRPLMEAFEAELREMLKLSDSENTAPQHDSENTAPRRDSPPTAEPSHSTTSQRTPHPVEILAAHVMDQVVNGANMVQSEWRSRVPELQIQLQNAQRQLEAAQKSLPQTVQVSLRALLASLEVHLRTALDHFPDGGRQMTENAADSVRMMTTELTNVGRTLFAAFESEFGRAAPTTPSNNVPAASGPGCHQDPTYPQSNIPHNKFTAAPSETQSTNSMATSTLYNNMKPASTSVPPPFCPPYPVPPSYNAPPPMPTSGAIPGPSFPNYYSPPSYSFPSQFLRHPAPLPRSQPASTLSSSEGPSKIKASVAQSGGLEVSPATTSLFIGNVGSEVTEKLIQDVFASKNFIVDVDLPIDDISQTHPGFGYVHFPSDSAASAAMEALQGALIDGHSINLEHLEKKEPNPNKIEYQAPRKHVLENSTMRGAGSSTTQVESTALLDSPSDELAFDANFPPLLPETSASRRNSSEPQGFSLFPPISQSDAKSRVDCSTTGQTDNTANFWPQSTESQQPQFGPYNPATIRDMEESVRDPATAAMSPWTRDDPYGPNYNYHVPGSFQAEQTRPDLTPVENNAGAESANIEECVSTLLSMGYGVEEEGGRTRVAMYATLANGNLGDAIEMIEEEREAYKQRASQ